MNQKKVFLLLISLVMISSFANFVSAQEEEGLAGTFDVIRRLFSFIPEMITLEKLADGEPTAVFWAKFLVWLLLFSVVFFGATAVPGLKENKRIAVIIAIVISIISAVMIPNEIIFNIFQTYGLIAGVLLWFIPLGAALYINHKIENRWLKVLFLFGALIILLNINAALVSLFGAERLFDWFGLLLAIVIFMFIWNLIALAGGKGRVHDWASDKGKGFWDWATRPREKGGGAVATPEDAKKIIKKEEKDIFWYLKKELKYFLRLYTIAENLDILAKKADIKDQRLLKEMQKYLKQLKTFERREQLRARIPKLKDAIDKLLVSSRLNDAAKRKIEPLVEKMRVFEGDLLKTTVEKLDPLIKGKKRITEINYPQLSEITGKLEQDLRALVALDKELQEIFKEIKKALKV